MKKLIYFVVCCAIVVAFGSCKSKTQATALTPALAAKEYHECLKDGNYETFVEAIVFEEAAAAPAMTSEKKKAANIVTAKALKTINHETVQEKGGLKDVTIVSEIVSADGQTADVILAGTYNNGEIETITYKMVNDKKDWKIRVTDNKEVWRATTKDGDREVIKLRDGDRRDFIKVKNDEHRDIVKDIDGVNRDVEKILMDGNREIHIERTTPNGEVIKVIENGKVISAVKTKNTENRSVTKEITEGEKNFVKVIEKRDGQVEVIKTLNDGHRHREVIKNIEDDNRSIDKVKEDGDKIVLKVKEVGDKEITKAKEVIDGEVVSSKKIVE